MQIRGTLDLDLNLSRVRFVFTPSLALLALRHSQQPLAHGDTPI